MKVNVKGVSASEEMYMRIAVTGYNWDNYNVGDSVPIEVGGGNVPSW